MGQLRPIKGYDTLIRAFIRLRELTDRPVRLEIAGVGSLREDLQGLIDAGGAGMAAVWWGPSRGMRCPPL